MDLIDSLIGFRTEVDGKWVVARPVNHKYRSLRQRLVDAWAVFIGKADAVTYYKQ